MFCVCFQDDFLPRKSKPLQPAAKISRLGVFDSLVGHFLSSFRAIQDRGYLTTWRLRIVQHPQPTCLAATTDVLPHGDAASPIHDIGDNYRHALLSPVRTA